MNEVRKTDLKPCPFCGGIEHYVNHVMDEITKRDVESVSEKLRALGWEEVVRCRDCKHYQDHNFGGKIDWCRYFHHDIETDGFCAWGKRKAGGKHE